MNLLIYSPRDGENLSLTTESASSSYGIPVMRIESPELTGDFGPADLLGPNLTAAKALVGLHHNIPLEGDALEAAKQFLSQWPDGPQIN